MKYFQINRWFANRRRKQMKRRKTDGESPRMAASLSVTTATVGTGDSEGRNFVWSKSHTDGWLLRESNLSHL